MFLFYLNVIAQHGDYFVKNYLPKDYNAHANNFAICQDQYGRILSANSNGILIYDGFNWDLVKSKDEDPVMSLFKSKDNTIYYSLDATNDFGIFEQNNQGKFLYNSLLNNLSDEYRPQEPIKHIFENGGSIYFLSSDKLLEYRNKTFTQYLPNNSFNIRGLLIGKHTFYIDLNNQILVLERGRLKPIKNTELLSKHKAFFSYKIDETTYAIGFRDVGMYIAKYDSINPTNTKFIKIKASCDLELIESEIINGTLLNDGNFVFTSNKKGAFLIDKSFNIITRFNTKTGLYEDNVKAVIQDNNGNLWFPNYYGISFVEINTPLLRYGRQNGISGLIASSCYYNNKLYVGTDKGLQSFNPSLNLFEDVLSFKKQIWFLLNYNNKLFICTSKGIYVYNGNNIKQISNENTTYLYNDLNQKDIIYAATAYGVDIYKILGEELHHIKTIELNDEVKTITSDEKRNIFFVTAFNGVFYLNSKHGHKLDSIKKQEGLPDEKRENFLFNYRSKLLIGTGNGIYSMYEKEDGRFYCKPDPVFFPLTKDREIYRALELNNDLLCSQTAKAESHENYETKYVYFKTQRNTVVEDNSGISKLKGVKPNSISYDSTQKVILISADEGLFLLHQMKYTQKKTYSFLLNSLINKDDTLLLNVSKKFKVQNISIPYHYNNLTFKFGYTCYENIDVIEFSYHLKGKDEQTDKWIKKPEITFSNLFEGEYTLNVKAKNGITNEVSELSITFTILPPWYRSVFAYIVYVLLLAIFIVFIVKLNTKRLRLQNIKLEGIIDQRTATIKEQVHLLKHQKQEITDSINYAKGIQDSILPEFDKILQSCKNIFIFFQPKDIVSGDFYWYKKISENEFLIACADCTGHGVPGGFMSMICSDKLHDAAKENDNPAKILFETNNGVKTTLKQESLTEGKSRDGMEVCLLNINTLTRKVKYSGANRLLWIIDGQTKELQEIKPTKASVASFTEFNFEYTEHEIQLKEGDLLYTTSDGYPDQFGGPDGKKYMSKKMKNFLVSICHLDMHEQEKRIRQEINEWMGNTEQVDDLLVIGIRL